MDFLKNFFFYGFFPEKKNLINDLKNISKLDSSIVFFISPKKIDRIIPYLKENFSGRKILICREMTKYFEEFIRTEVCKLGLFEFEMKGELTVVISGNELIKNDYQILSESDKKLIKEMINKLTIKEITNVINKEKKISKKLIYNYCVKLKNEN